VSKGLITVIRVRSCRRLELERFLKFLAWVIRVIRFLREIRVTAVILEH
jgi:hypothetical protein